MPNGHDKLKEQLAKIRKRRQEAATGQAADGVEVQQFVDPSRPSRTGDKLNLQLLRIKEAQIARTPETGADPRSAAQIPLQERVETFERQTPFMARFGARLVRGFKGLQQGFISSGAQTRASTLAQLEAIESGRKVPFFTGVRDPDRTGEMTNVAGFRKLSSQERKKRIRNLRSRVAGDVSKIVRLQREIAEIPQNPAAEAVGAAETFEEAFEAFKVDPIGVVAQFGVESGVRSAPSLVLGTAGALLGGPPGAAAGTGFGSGFVESQAGIVEGLSRLGVDISDPEAIKEALQDEAIGRDVRDFARARALIIGGFDALSGGLASRTLAPRAISSGLVRQAVNVPVQTTTQGMLGAAGEAAAQVATTGEIQPGEIVAEALGEVFGAPVEVAALGAAARRPQDALQAKLDGLREAEAPTAAPTAPEQAPEQPQAPPRAPEVEPEQQAPVERAPAPEPAFGRSLEEAELAALRESQDPQVQQAADLLTTELQKPFAEQNLETIESATQLLRGGVPLIPAEQADAGIDTTEIPRQQQDDGPTQALPERDQPAIDAGRAPEARREVEQEQVTPEEAQAPAPEVPGRRTTQELLDEAAVSPRPEEANIEAQLGQARRELTTARRRLADEEARLLGLRGEGRQADVFTGAPEAPAPEQDIFGEVPTPGRQDVERVLAPLQSDVRAQQANVLALESEAKEARQDIRRQLDIDQAIEQAAPPVLFTASDGRTEVRSGDEPGQIAVFNGQTGKRLDRRSRAFEPAVAQYFSAEIESIDQARRVTDDQPEIRLDEFPRVVAQESENPFEIVEAYAIERDVEQAQAAGISPVLEAVESAMQQGRISTESFDRFGDPNRRRDDRQITLNYLGGDIALDTLAEEITTDTGIETTPGELVEIIEEFPAGPRTFRARSRVLPDLAERFEELTGLRLTGSLVDQIVEQSYTPTRADRGIAAPFEPRAPFIADRAREPGESGRVAAYQAAYARLGYPVRKGEERSRQLAAEALTDFREQLDLFAPTLRQELETTERQRVEGQERRRDERAGRVTPVEGRLLARGIAEVLEDRSTEALIGKVVRSPDDFAAVAQVLRDPRFETLRYAFVKDGRIVGVRAHSLRLPGVAESFPPATSVQIEQARAQAVSESQQREVTEENLRDNFLSRRIQELTDEIITDWLQGEIAGFGADGFYMLHNHPSGRVEPSRADISETRKVAALAPSGFLGHVIIDSGKYTVIEQGTRLPDARTSLARAGITVRSNLELPKSALPLANIDPETGRDALLSPSIDHPSIGKRVESPLDLAITASNALRDSQNMVVMIGLGSDGLVRGLLELPWRTFVQREGPRLRAGTTAMTKGQQEIQDRVLAFARETGSSTVSLAGVPSQIKVSRGEGLRRVASIDTVLTRMVRAGVFLDVIFEDGSSKQEGGIVNQDDPVFFGFDIRNLRQIVAEEPAPYDPSDHRKPHPGRSTSRTRQEVEARVGRLGRPGPAVPPGPDEATLRLQNPSANALHHSASALVDQKPREVRPGWAVDEAETPAGKKLLNRLRRDTKGAKVGMRSIVAYLTDAIGIELRIGPENTTRGQPAIYERARNLARSRSGVATHNFHEAGHGISALMELGSPALLQHPGLVELTQAEGSLASMETPEEGFAEWVRIFVMDPGRLETPEMAGLTAAVTRRLSEHCPKCLATLRDSARMVEAHLGRSVAAQFRSMNTDRPSLPGFVDQLRDAVDRVLFTVGSRSWAIERTERKIWRAFRENVADRKEADRLARSFFRSVRDTPADLRQAYQSILRINAEVATAIIGTKKVKGLRIFTTGAGIQINSQEVAQLESAGIPVADGMKDASQKHGQMVQLTDFALQSVVEKVGSNNWADFENYAQALVSLERFAVKGLAYPGWETLGPAQMAEIVRVYEEANPQWRESFRLINQYADQMLVVAVTGGHISVESAVAMKLAWEHYIPLLRVPERSSSSRKASSAGRVDAGFRRAKGSELPIMPLLEALEQRTRQVLDAYYTNRSMLAPVKMAEHAQRSQELPFELRTLVGRVVTPLKGITVPVANLSKPEAKIIIAQFLNDQILTEKIERQTAGGLAPSAQELEALRAEGLDPGEIVSPGDISLSWSGMDIWRSADPRGINIIAPKVNGEYQFFQVEDPILYDFFAKSADVGQVMDLLFNKILSRVVEPWKRALTQNAVFALRNSLARDPATAAFYGVGPEASPELTAREGAKTLLPGYFLSVGLVQQLTGRVPSAVVQGELLSRTYQTTTSAAHKARVSRFREVFEEGVVIDGYFQMPGVERLAAAPGQLMSALLKPVDIFLWGTGQRAFAQMTEDATRLGAYAAVKKAGLSDEAAQRAYDIVSGNFGERPASGGVQAVYRSAGFLNPGTQVAMEFVRRATSTDPEIRWRAVAARMASIALFTAVGWAVNKMLTSDEREEELRERPDWDRLQYMPIGGYIKLPFDYGPIGAVQSFTWNMLDTAAGDGPRAKSMARILLLRVIDLPGSPTAFVNPQLLILAVENPANYSFFYGEPIEPPYFDFLPPEQRVFYSTPGFYRWLGEMSGQSPVKIGNFVRNGLSAQIDGAIKIIDRLNSGRPMQDLADIPLFGRLIQRTPRAWGTRSVGEVVELDEKFRAVRVLYERAIEDPSSSQERREELARRMNSLARSHQAMLAIQRQQDQIRLAREQGRFDLVPQLQQNMEEIAARALSDSGLFPAPQEPVP